MIPERSTAQRSKPTRRTGRHPISRRIASDKKDRSPVARVHVTFVGGKQQIVLPAPVWKIAKAVNSVQHTHGHKRDPVPDGVPDVSEGAPKNGKHGTGKNTG